MQRVDYECINDALTTKYQADPKYQVFMDWLLENGAKIHPSVRYPVAFGPRGYIGVAVQSEIDSYEGIIAIPKSLIIDIERVIANQQLMMAISKFPTLFKQIDQQQNNFNMIALFLTYERAKGASSFFKPYFDAAQCHNLILHWTAQELEEIENTQIIHYIKQYQSEMRVQGDQFIELIQQHPSLFPSQIPTHTYREYFQWSFEFIMTRAFGWPVPDSYLIPFADMLNHGQQSMDHCILDIQKETSNGKAGEYRFKAKKCDLSLLGNSAVGVRSKQLARVKRLQPSKRQRYINSHRQLLEDDASDQDSKQTVYKIAYQEYNNGKKKFRQLFFDTSSCSEDNDTKNEDIVCRQFNKEIIKIQDKQILRTRSKSLQDSLSNYWTTYSYNQYVPIISSQSKDLNDGLAVELSSNSQKSKQSDSDKSIEDSYQWISESDPGNVYFVLYTSHKYKCGEQLYNFYGKRPNKFFVIGYNFAFLSNKYDSFEFRLYFENKNMEPKQSVFDVCEYLQKGRDVEAQTTGIRLKMNRVCVELINHCRALILSKFSNKEHIFGIPTTIPVQKTLESRAIEYAKDIVRYKLQQFKTSIQDDQKLLEDQDLESRKQTAVILRMSYKLILGKQLEYMDYCQQVLDRWKGGRLHFPLTEMGKLATIKDYVYILDRSTL